MASFAWTRHCTFASCVGGAETRSTNEVISCGAASTMKMPGQREERRGEWEHRGDGAAERRRENEKADTDHEDGREDRSPEAEDDPGEAQHRHRRVQRLRRRGLRVSQAKEREEESRGAVDARRDREGPESARREADRSALGGAGRDVVQGVHHCHDEARIEDTGEQAQEAHGRHAHERHADPGIEHEAKGLADEARAVEVVAPEGRDGEGRRQEQECPAEDGGARNGQSGGVEELRQQPAREGDEDDDVLRVDVRSSQRKASVQPRARRARARVRPRTGSPCSSGSSVPAPG